MRLIKLSSTVTSFKTVRFNPFGLSLVVGRHSKLGENNPHSTYNGVGKSLLVALLHYCLGSNKNPQFEKHLRDWDFTLTFEHGGREHQVTRTVGHSEIFFDGRGMGHAPFKRELDALRVFPLPADVSGISFRSLISFFLRPGRASYSAPEAAVPEWTPYYRILNQSFLLGLDYHRVVRKHDAKKRLDEQVALAEKYKKDEVLREFYLNGKDAEIEVASLTEKIEKLERDLAAFVVAEDYGQREMEANALRIRVAEARNETVLATQRLEDIDASLEMRPDVAPERVRRLFNEANFVLPEAVSKRLDEVEAFHARLRENRLRRLKQEREATAEELRRWHAKQRELERDLDARVQYLRAHRALDEYVENNRYLSELTARRSKILDYLSLLEKYTSEAQRIRAEMGQATVDTTKYLESIKPLRDHLMEVFRGFVREFYGENRGGLTVRNNDKDDNQIRYQIEPKIQHDQADGINSVRIFCFDLLLLTLRQRHGVDFLFHDSRLFADMDAHQRLTLFRMADRECRKHGWQYIATINDDNVESLRGPAGEDFDGLFVQSKILELTDEADGSGKLLGKQIEMRYEEKADAG